jgi:hypothetical protein
MKELVWIESPEDTVVLDTIINAKQMVKFNTMTGGKRKRRPRKNTTKKRYRKRE